MTDKEVIKIYEEWCKNVYHAGPNLSLESKIALILHIRDKVEESVRKEIEESNGY